MRANAAPLQTRVESRIDRIGGDGRGKECDQSNRRKSHAHDGVLGVEVEYRRLA
jgi:hypothetical protein